MAILRKRHAQYTVIPKGIFCDSRLNLRDVGLLCFMLHLPDDWNFSVAGLCAMRGGDGRDAIRKSVRKLEECGYLQRSQARDTETGKMGEAIWYLYDVPMTENPTSAKPMSETPTSVNPTQSNTKEPNTKKLNTNLRRITLALSTARVRISAILSRKMAQKKPPMMAACMIIRSPLRSRLTIGRQEKFRSETVC